MCSVRITSLLSSGSFSWMPECGNSSFALYQGFGLSWDSQNHSLIILVTSCSTHHVFKRTGMDQAVLGHMGPPLQERVEKAAAIFLSWARSSPGIGRVSWLYEAPVGRSQDAEFVFSTAITKALVGTCKSKRITFAATAHILYIGAVNKQVTPQSNLSEYVTASQFSLRPSLPEPHGTRKYVVSVYYKPYTFKTDLTSS